MFPRCTATGLAEGDDVLDHSEHLCDIGAYSRFAAMLRLSAVVDLAVVEIAPVGKILGARGAFADGIRLGLIILSTPDTRLLSVQQTGQRLAIVHLDRRDQRGVDLLGVTVDADMRLHPDVPLPALRRSRSPSSTSSASSSSPHGPDGFIRRDG
jgi:hypothetical protein